jgi:hypothetical protein
VARVQIEAGNRVRRSQRHGQNKFCDPLVEMIRHRCVSRSSVAPVRRSEPSTAVVALSVERRQREGVQARLASHTT